MTLLKDKLTELFVADVVERVKRGELSLADVLSVPGVSEWLEKKSAEKKGNESKGDK